MNDFNYSYPTKVYFGAGAAKKAFAAELGKFGKPFCWHTAAVRLKRTVPMMKSDHCFRKREKKLLSLAVLCRTPPIKKYRRAQGLHRKTMLTSLLLSAAAASLTVAR